MWRTRSRRHFRAWFLDSGLRRNDERIGPRSPLRGTPTPCRIELRTTASASPLPRRPPIDTPPHRHPSPRPGRARRRRACLQDTIRRPGEGRGPVRRPRRHPRDHRHHAPQATRRPQAVRPPGTRAPIDTRPTAILHPVRVERAGEGHGLRTRFVAPAKAGVQSGARAGNHARPPAPHTPNAAAHSPPAARPGTRRAHQQAPCRYTSPRPRTACGPGCGPA